MSVLDTKPLLPDFIKMRWMEPYTSAGLNRKTFKSLPRGFYNGFTVRPGPGALWVTVRNDDPLGWDATSGYSAGAFDSASGWGVAVHASLAGYTSTVAIQAGVSGNFEFDLSGSAGSSVFLALDVQYKLGYPTTGEVKVVQAADLDLDPTLMVVAKVDVPSMGSISDANIIYDDAVYPRVLPFASKRKYGFMSKVQSEVLDLLASNAVSGAPIFDDEVLIVVDGPQDVLIPGGNVYTVGGGDLWVFKNGVKMRAGALRDYVEVDRGDGYGVKVTWVGLNLRAGDRITFRVQKYAAGLMGTLNVLDESSSIETNTIQMNFVGSGVAVLPDGYRRVKISIPGGGGAAATKGKRNSTGSTIPQFRAVRVLGDNTMALYDPKVSGQSLYGLTLQAVPDGTLGDVQVAGVVPGAGAQVSGSVIGSDVYVSHLGDGSLTTVPPDPVSGSVVRVGILDGADAVSGGFGIDIVFDRGRLT